MFSGRNLAAVINEHRALLIDVMGSLFPLESEIVAVAVTTSGKKPAMERRNNRGKIVYKAGGNSLCAVEQP